MKKKTYAMFNYFKTRFRQASFLCTNQIKVVGRDRSRKFRKGRLGRQLHRYYLFYLKITQYSKRKGWGATLGSLL